MATIDELIVRLDADLKPLEAKLNRATKQLKDFEAFANRSLGRVNAGFEGRFPNPFTASQMARLGFRTRPGGPERAGAARVAAAEVRAGAGATVTEVSETRPALAAGPILIEIGISVAGSLLADAVKDALRTRDLDIPEQVLKGIKEPTFEPSAAGDIAVEFQMAADELRKAAEESSVAFQRFSNLEFGEEADQIASAIEEKLEEQLALRAAALQSALNIALKDLERSGPEGREKVSQAQPLTQDVFQDISALQSEQAIDLEKFAQQFDKLLQFLDESQRESLQQLGQQVEDFAAVVDRSRRNELTPEAQERRERALAERERTQTLQLEIPEGLGNACDCIRDLFDRFFGPGGNEPGGDLQSASFIGAAAGASLGIAPAIDGQAAAWQAVLDRLDKVPPALARTRRETLDVDRAVRDLGFTFASAFEDAIVSGESLSDILQGLEQDILRILTRLLITEPLARGLTAGLGSFTGGGLGSGGGLEGLIGGGLGALANLFPSPVAGLGLGSFNALDALAAQDVANPLLAGIFQAGGPVHGPGGPTGDRIPAFLSDGEFVVNAEATRRNRQILEAINSNRLRRHVEEGGQIGMTLPEIPPIRRGQAPALPDNTMALRPIVMHFHGVTDHGSFQRNMPQFRGQLRELLSRAEKRDD